MNDTPSSSSETRCDASISTGDFFDRLAGAPISWGVCEVPGWGIELPVERVLSEMAELGLKATELGSDGYLPTDPAELRDTCAAHGLEMIGGFVPVVLHDPTQREPAIAAIHRAATLLSEAGGSVFVTAGVTTWDWAPRSELTAEDWDHAAEMLSVTAQIVGDYGLVQAVHPHLGTIIETRADVTALLDRSDAGWCFDTGHLLIGGYDPEQFLRDARDRITHVHLKDVDMSVAERVNAGELSLMQGVQAGMFTPMGEGDVPIGDIVTSLERSGYDAWYVLEQDAAITAGEPPAGEGPKLDVQQSVDYLRAVVSAIDPVDHIALGGDET